MVKTVMEFMCDICKNKVQPDQLFQQVKLPIIFHSETTEGRPTKAHIEFETVDVCRDCLMKAININAVGAQGNNRYWFGGEQDAAD